MTCENGEPMPPQPTSCDACGSNACVVSIVASGIEEGSPTTSYRCHPGPLACSLCGNSKGCTLESDRVVCSYAAP